MATLNIKKTEVEAIEQPTPVLDRTKNFGEVGGEHGVKYVQGNAYFRANGDFARYVDPGLGLAPETPEMARNRKQKEAKDNAHWGRVPVAGGAPALPQKVVEAAKENARALAAEAAAG